MDRNIKSKEEIQKMMALNEEINNLNVKIKQLVEDLGSTQNVLGSVQELAGQLTNKVSQFNDSSKSYTTPNTNLNDEMGTPSYKSAGMERERIVPTPENINDYRPQTVQPVAQPVSDGGVKDSESTHQAGTKVTQRQELRKATKQSRKNRQVKKSGWGFGGNK
tara:strand:+ start:387 stop:875 length:489 start_codon:yes stop_codon:yes gene_type:complete